MRQTLRRVLALVGKEILAVLRDPRSRFVVIGPPIVQFFVFGYAATFEVSDVRYAVLDESRTASSRDLLAAIEASSAFRLVDTLSSTDDIAGVIDRQDARVVVHIGEELERDLEMGTPASVQVIADGRNSNVSSIALSYVSDIVASWRPGRDARTRRDLVEVVDRAWFNENLRSRWYIVAPMAAAIAMVVVILSSSLSVAREREFGTFDQLLVAPFRPSELLVGKAIPGIVFGMVDGTLLSFAAAWWFEVPLRGTLPALVAMLAAFSLAIVGVGLFISSTATTMQQGLLGSFAFIMPSVVLSGFTTPVENMPEWLQVATRLNPLRYAVAGLRRVFLEGAGAGEVSSELWPLLAIAAVTLPAAAWMFRRRTG